MRVVEPSYVRYRAVGVEGAGGISRVDAGGMSGQVKIVGGGVGEQGVIGDIADPRERDGAASIVEICVPRHIGIVK